MTQIVVLDGFTENPGDLSWAGLEALGQLRVYPRTKPEEIIPRIGQADIVWQQTLLLRLCTGRRPLPRLSGRTW